MAAKRGSGKGRKTGNGNTSRKKPIKPTKATAYIPRVKIPKPVLVEHDVTRTSVKQQRTYADTTSTTFKFKDREKLRKVLLKLTDKHGEDIKSVRVSLGIGKGRNRDWISSPYDNPLSAATILYGWESRGSAQKILNELEDPEDYDVEYELEMLTDEDIT